MHRDDARRSEAAKSDCFLDPKQNIVTRATTVVSEIVVEAQCLNEARLEMGNGFFWPTRGDPTGRRGALVIKIKFHR